MEQTKHKNHFVPQLYLKNWANNKNEIWTHRLLVPNRNFKSWNLKPISGVAYQRDLYTIFLNRQEDDEFERWIDAEFESPVKTTLIKVIHEKELKSDDWIKLSNFLALQDLRTPLSYIEFNERWSKDLPVMMETVLEKGVKKIEDGSIRNVTIPKENSYGEFGDLFKFSILRNALPEEKKALLTAEIVNGRKLWLASIRHLLLNTAKELQNHKWSIANPAKGMTWFTSDHPVIRLNYWHENNYDFGGGWGKSGSNLLFPLTPNHLLYTQIGKDSPDNFSFSTEKTYEIQKIIAQRAYRWIFSHIRFNGINRLRPRLNNLEVFNQEEEQRKNWHQNQSEFEL